MSNIFIVSPNLHMNVKNNNLFINKKESKFFVKKLIKEKEIRISKIKKYFS